MVNGPYIAYEINLQFQFVMTRWIYRNAEVHILVRSYLEGGLEGVIPVNRSAFSVVVFLSYCLWTVVLINDVQETATVLCHFFSSYPYRLANISHSKRGAKITDEKVTL